MKSKLKGKETVKPKLDKWGKFTIFVSFLGFLLFSFNAIYGYMKYETIRYSSIFFAVGSLISLFYLVMKHNATKASEADNAFGILGMIGLVFQN